MTAATRQKARRERELAMGRRGRLLFLTDEEYANLKEILKFSRAHDGRVRVEMKKLRKDA